MRFSRLAAAVVAAAMLSTVAPPASATEEDAKTFFADGRRLRTEGKCADAIVSFRRALDVYPEGLGSLRNIAECEEQLGQYASARNDWWALRRAALQSNEAKYAGWVKDAEDGYNRLATKVAKLTIKVEGEQLERVRIQIDGKPLDPRLLGVALERDLGAHNIEVSYGGVSPIVEKRTLAPGASEVVVVKVPSVRDTVPGPGAQRDDTTLKAAGFVALGVGGLGLIGLGVSAAVRQGALSNIDAVCPGYKNCPKNLAGDKDTGQTASVLANVFGVVGIVGVGAGATMLGVAYLRGGPKPAKTGEVKANAGLFAPRDISFAITPTPNGAALFGEGRF